MIPEQHLSLSRLQAQVKGVLAERFALPVWVAAEVSELKVNYSGHCYLELVEKGEADGIPKAQARAVIWRSHYPRLAGYFEAETGQRLAAGMKILFKATVNYHELYGFSLQITDLDASYTLGDMERQRQQTIARLRQDGVWEMNRETEMPAVVQRIAVVSSRQAAGYQDFCKEIGKSPYDFRVTLFDAFMQGAAAEDSIIAALGEIAEQCDRFDAVVLIRGGGSASDLNCFNAYRLCSYVAQFPLPVITGIGHDKDTSVADMVAHTALKTPTAVAGWLVERMARADARLAEAAQRLHDATVGILRTCEQTLGRHRGDLARLSAAAAAHHAAHLDHLAVRLPEAVREFLAQRAARLDTAAELAESRSPQRILRLGFALVRCGGKTVRSAAAVGPGDRLDIELADGTIRAEAKRPHTHPAPSGTDRAGTPTD